MKQGTKLFLTAFSYYDDENWVLHGWWDLLPGAILALLIVARIIVAVCRRDVGCKCFQEFLASLDEDEYEGGSFMGVDHSPEIFTMLFVVYAFATIFGSSIYCSMIGEMHRRHEMLRGLGAYAGLLAAMGLTHQFCIPHYRRLLIRWVLCSQDIGTAEEMLMGYLPVDVSPYLEETNNYRADVNDKEDCSICADEMTDQVCKLTCGHAFHAPCAAQWLRRVPSCPMCRQPVVLKPLGTVLGPTMVTMPRRRSVLEEFCQIY
ncbi:hypothetical protein PSACC_01265 [Paramicrosporidium saccamoebae]|uniref:RING-type domain-containing protein n=1 Tax=Paramicrosporidium saccamoebae TaxID=1246581 RepID=A0A2H9TMD5_9FUNG|nr:hypothetical protein PSACC_01265 [Paramicrosporidium saccamoebae]